MRRVGRSEIILYKCPTCGSKNKIYTIINDSAGNRIGSSMKCCNCGTLIKRFNDLDGTVKDEQGDSFPGKQYCIKLHWCKNCSSCKLNNKSEDNSDDNKENNCCDCSKCKYRDCCRKLKSSKLTINVSKVIKFLN